MQYNIVRIDGQRSVYVPVFKQGGDSNTITIVNGMKAAIKHLVDIPESLKTAVVFDQSVFVKLAIANVSKEAGIGLVLTGLMILVFLGSPRATVAVLLSVPLVDGGLPADQQLHGRLDQHDDSGRIGAGLLAAHR